MPLGGDVEDASRDARPAPPIDGRASGGRADRLALRAPEREDSLDALAQRVRVAAREADELAKTWRVGGLELVGNLGESGVVGDDRRAAGRRRLGRDHA